MPRYDYQHTENSKCDAGNIFEITHALSDPALTTCPYCKQSIQRIISGVNVAKAKAGDSDLRKMGFTKLVRRDKGVYENVTAIDGESKVWDASKPETAPHLHKRIQD